MDREVLRWGIIALGVVAVLGLILWSYLKNRRRKRTLNFSSRGNTIGRIDESLRLHSEHDDFEIVPIGSALDEEIDSNAIHSGDTEQSGAAVSDESWPDLLQFSIAAKSEHGFDALKVVQACQRAGLEYGSMQVFERVDALRRVDYAVANMVQPGTFPETGLEDFFCPGLVFFLQPKQVEDPGTVFEDLLQTLEYLSDELDGVPWDAQRQPLSEEMIQYYRRLFSA